MTPDEQEAGSIRYATQFHLAKLRSGNYALFNGRHQPIVIADFQGICDAIAKLETFVAPVLTTPSIVSDDDFLASLGL